MAKWMDFGDGIYCCSHCGMPSGWSHPALTCQSLAQYCSRCGDKMENHDLSNRTPREKVRAHWILKEKGAHRYYCSVCGGKESAPRVWCPRCGTHMDDDAWEKRWCIQKEYERTRGVNDAPKYADFLEACNDDFHD